MYFLDKEKRCEATKAETSDDTRRSTDSREVGYIYKEIDCKVLQEIKPFKGTLPRDLLLPFVFSQPPTANADVSPISDWAPVLDLNIRHDTNIHILVPSCLCNGTIIYCNSPYIEFNQLCTVALNFIIMYRRQQFPCKLGKIHESSSG